MSIQGGVGHLEYLFWETKVERIINFFVFSSLYLRWNVFKISYTMNSIIIISLPCILSISLIYQPYKQSSNNVVFGMSLEKAIATLIFKACCGNIQWCKNTCYLEVGFKAWENIHVSKNTDYWVKIPIGLQSSLGLTLPLWSSQGSNSPPPIDHTRPSRRWCRIQVSRHFYSEINWGFSGFASFMNIYHMGE